MSAIGYYNGTIGPLETMTIPLLDRSTYFGDGCYEALLYRNGKGFALERHLDRFARSLSLLRIDPPCSREELKAILSECVAASGEREAMVYWQVSRGTAKRTHGFPKGVRPNLTVMVTPKAIPPMCADVRLMTAEDIRFTMCNVKTLNLLPNVLTNQAAAERGLDGAIFVRDGIVTEGTHSNVSILKDGALYTHPADHLILKGVTRDLLLALCPRLGIEAREEPFTKAALFDADEILISSSTANIRRAVELDGQPVGGKAPALLYALQEAYYQTLLEETNE